MKATNGKVLVRVDMEQKNAMKIGDVVCKTANNFGTNYRERSPVIGVFDEGTEYFDKGDFALFHHNHFYHPSPYYLQDDLYSVPLNKTIFGLLNHNREMTPLFGNMICKKIPIPTALPLPPDEQKFYNDQYEIVDSGWTIYKTGDIIFTRPHSGYEIVYIFDKEEKRVIKVDSEMVCGILK